ncbi:hypothetical protein QL093DRAFT_2025241, partial [Fusarium oxysporum]
FRHQWSSGPPIHERVNLSSALLTEVTRIQVMEDEELGFCKAILLGYSNGARRALGNCRLGIDRADSYLNTSRICYRSVGYALGRRRDIPAIHIQAGSDSGHHHDEDDWVCSTIDDVVELWFLERTSCYSSGEVGAGSG